MAHGGAALPQSMAHGLWQAVIGSFWNIGLGFFSASSAALRERSGVLFRNLSRQTRLRLPRLRVNPARSIFIALLAFACLFVQPAAAQHVSIRDVPLQPWGGFARSWHWSYDALRKLVIAGVTGPVVLNLKPMSRREVALILARVLRRLDRNEAPDIAHRSDLQDTLDELVVEFSPELLALGVTDFEIGGDVPRWLEAKPLEHVQVRAGYASNSATGLENRNGERLGQGWTGRAATSSWVEAGGHGALYLHPELALDEDDLRGRLVEGYAKGRLGFAELLVGRESIWWGPGFHGSMLFSNNAVGVDMVRLQTAQQVTLPWILRHLGPLKAQVFFAQLEREREFPRAKLAAARLNLAPFRWLELGVARVVMFGGEGRSDIEFYEYPRVFFTGNRPGREGSKYAGNNLSQVDVTLRLAEVGKHVPISRDAELYLDFGWDDTCCENFYTPLQPGIIAGLYLPNLLYSPVTALTLEYSNTSTLQFNHGTWRSGFGRKGHVLSHFIGTKGEDLLVRLTHRPVGTVEVGLEFDMARRGDITASGESLKERHRHVGLDLSYQHSAALSLQVEGRVEWVRNRDFVANDDDVNLVGLVTGTYAFGRSYGAGR